MKYRIVACLLTLGALAPLGGHAGDTADNGPAFGPLVTPARVNTAMAVTSRMTAIAEAGERLVAVGPRGHVLVSDDQGGSWEQVPVPVSSDLVAVHFPDPQHGWAVGHDGVVLHSADAGQSWQKQLDGLQAARLVEAFIDAEGEALDEEARFEAYRLVDEGADKPFLAVHFLSPRKGFVVGAFNYGFYTEDGGASWQPLLGRIDNPLGYHIYGLAEAAGQVWLAGEKGLLLRWDDQAQAFTEAPSPYSGSYFGVIGNAGRLVVFGLRGNAWVSDDAGENWARVQTGVSDSITDGAFLADGRFVLVTQGGQIRLSEGQGTQTRELRVDRAMAYAGVAAAGGEALALVGSGGVRTAALAQAAQSVSQARGE